MTKYFYDFEFEENGQTIIPISLGIVSEYFDNLYFVNSDYDWDNSTEWLINNVKPNLYTNELNPIKIKFSKLKDYLPIWFDNEIELIGYYSDYDHVCLAQLFGKMIELPDKLPMYTLDLKQWLMDLGNPRIPFKPKVEHNAFFDAIKNKQTYDWLVENYNHPAWSK